MTENSLQDCITSHHCDIYHLTLHSVALVKEQYDQPTQDFQ